MSNIFKKQPRNHPTSRKIPKIIYIYLYFYGLAPGELRTRARRVETRVGSRYPKKTHARSDAKARLYKGRPPETHQTCVWRPQKYVCMKSERKTTTQKAYITFSSDIKSHEREATNKKRSVSFRSDIIKKSVKKVIYVSL